MKSMIALFLCASTVCVAQSSMPTTFRSIYAPHDVPLLTDPRSTFWQGAEPVYAERDTYGHHVPLHRTEIRSRWTHDSLYLLFICPYQKLYLKRHPSHSQETYGLWKWDVAELFLGTDFQDIKRYKEFEVSPQGEWVDLDVNLHLPDHTVGWTWNSGFQVEAQIDRKAGVWYGAMRIPFSGIDLHAPYAGQLFRANLLRSQGPPKDQHSIAWQTPMADTFHTPNSFGLLKLVETK